MAPVSQEELAMVADIGRETKQFSPLTPNVIEEAQSIGDDMRRDTANTPDVSPASPPPLTPAVKTR